MTTSAHRVPLGARRHPPALVRHPVIGAARAAGAEADADADADAPSVLLLDGPPGTPFMWHRVLPVLRSRGVQARTVKRPDFPPADDLVVDPFAPAADLAATLDDQQREPAVVVGYSLGAGTALALAARAPEHVRALVLVAPAAGLQSISLADQVLATPTIGPALAWLGFRATGLALHIPLLRKGILTNRGGLAPDDAKHVAHYIAFGAAWRAFATEQRRVVVDARRRNRELGRIACPVLIVDAAPNRLPYRRAATAVQKLLPGSQVLTTDAASHLIPIDDPDSVAEAVLRVLRVEYRSSLSSRTGRSTRG
jgi:pimeloyl-ACP methyl ester carboxylesterase